MGLGGENLSAVAKRKGHWAAACCQLCDIQARRTEGTKEQWTSWMSRPVMRPS